MHQFKSRKDPLVITIVVSAMLLILYGIVNMIVQEPPRTNAFGLIVLVLAGLVLPGWMLLRTIYTIRDGVLDVRCGPFRYVLRADQITSVQAVHNYKAAPALSAHRLDIACSDYRHILVSPQDTVHFMQVLQEAGYVSGELVS